VKSGWGRKTAFWETALTPVRLGLLVSQNATSRELIGSTHFRMLVYKTAIVVEKFFEEAFLSL
jgi:hypothetical protein